MNFVDRAESLDGRCGCLEKGGGGMSGLAGNFRMSRHGFLFSSFALLSSIFTRKKGAQDHLRVRLGFKCEAYAWQMAFHAFLHVASVSLRVLLLV